MIQSGKKDIRDVTWEDILADNGQTRYNIIPTLADVMFSQEPEAFVRQVVTPISQTMLGSVGRNTTSDMTQSVYSLWVLYQLDYLMNAVTDTDSTYRRYFSKEEEEKNRSNLRILLVPQSEGKRLFVNDMQNRLYDRYDLDIIGMVWKAYHHIRHPDGSHMTFLFGKNKQDKRSATEHVYAIRREILRQLPGLPIVWGYANKGGEADTKPLRDISSWTQQKEDAVLWRDSFTRRLFPSSSRRPAPIFFLPAANSEDRYTPKESELPVHMKAVWASNKNWLALLSAADINMLMQPENIAAVYRPQMWYLLEQIGTEHILEEENLFPCIGKLIFRVLPESLPMLPDGDIMDSFRVLREVFCTLDKAGKSTTLAEAAMVKAANVLARSGHLQQDDLRKEVVSLLRERAPSPTTMYKALFGYDDYKPFQLTILPSIEQGMDAAERFKNRLGCLLAHKDYEDSKSLSLREDPLTRLRLCFREGGLQTEYILSQLLRATEPHHDNEMSSQDTYCYYYNVPSKRRAVMMLLALGELTEDLNEPAAPKNDCENDPEIQHIAEVSGTPFALTFSGKETQSFVLAMLLANNFITHMAIRLTVNRQSWGNTISFTWRHPGINRDNPIKGPLLGAEEINLAANLRLKSLLEGEHSILDIADTCAESFGEVLSGLADFYAPLCGVNPDSVKSWLRRPELYLDLLDVNLEDAPFLTPQNLEDSLTDYDRDLIDLGRRSVGIGMLCRKPIFGHDLIAMEYQRLAYLGAVDGVTGVLPGSRFNPAVDHHARQDTWVQIMKQRTDKTNSTTPQHSSESPRYE